MGPPSSGPDGREGAAALFNGTRRASRSAVEVELRTAAGKRLHLIIRLLAATNQGQQVRARHLHEQDRPQMRTGYCVGVARVYPVRNSAAWSDWLGGRARVARAGRPRVADVPEVHDHGPDIRVVEQVRRAKLQPAVRAVPVSKPVTHLDPLTRSGEQVGEPRRKPRAGVRVRQLPDVAPD